MTGFNSGAEENENSLYEAVEAFFEAAMELNLCHLSHDGNNK